MVDHLAANCVWILFAGFLVLFMQAGFALIDSGLCRAKNAAYTMSSNFMVFSLCTFGFLVCGYGLMCGGTSGLPTLNSMFRVHGWGVFGTRGFFLAGQTADASSLVWFVLMLAFAAASAAIPAGVLAERWNLKSFFCYSILIGAVIYPVYGCWVWGGGWLSQLGVRSGMGHGAVDYAGASVVHLQGGALGLALSWLLGPRIGKFDQAGRPRPILGHSIPLVTLGTSILAFGWFGFNVGSSLAAGDNLAAIVAVNTLIAAMAATLAGVVYMWFHFGKPDPSLMCNSMLGGLVAVSASCAFVSPFGAFVIGAVAGVLVVVSIFLWDYFRIDDPVGAVSIHGVNGAWGMLALGLFATGAHGQGYNGVAGAVGGLFYGYGIRQLGVQLIAVAACVGWNVLVGGALFWALGKIIHGNRVAVEVEIAGLDVPEMGAPGYPEFITTLSPEDVSTSEIRAASPIAKGFSGSGLG